jgi:ribokinase
MELRPITVIGSYNVGLFLKGDRLPAAGETIIGNHFFEGGGGKGSNQAVAASILGGNTRFFGRIGFDKYGQDALAMYRRLGINADTIRVDPSIHTGISVILIDRYGQNLISVIPGANFNLSCDDIEGALNTLCDSCMVACQLENRLEVVEYALRRTHEMGVTTFLDPAPAQPLPESLYPCIDIIKPNETEATILTGIQVRGPASAEDAGRWFLARGVKTAIITMGEQGATLVTTEGARHYHPPKVKAVDATGAGDTFAGALLTAVAEGKPIEDAIGFANHAAAISTTRLGVTEAIPTRAEVLASMEAERLRAACA